MSFYDYSTNLAETLRGSVSVLEDMFGTPLDQAFHTMFGGVGGTGGSIGGPFVPPPQATNRVPPASERVLRNLPVVCVRPEDLIDRANRECCICLEAINVNDRVLRLPCAHHFHGPCIRDWLQRNCSCPVCRFELPTDDAEYERGRLQRMRHRKPRYARHELERLNVSQLKELLRARKKPIPTHILDKTGLIDYVIASDAIEFIQRPPPEPSSSFRLSQLKAMPVKTLKHVMNEAGVFFDAKDVLEKDDMIEIFLLSGRLEVLPEEEVKGEEDDPPEDQKPAAKKSTSKQYNNGASGGGVAVETVDSDSENEDNGNHSDGKRNDTRSDKTVVLEANASYVQNKKDEKTYNASGSPIPTKHPAAATMPTTTTTTNQDNVQNTVNQKSAPVQRSNSDGLEEKFQDLSVEELELLQEQLAKEIRDRQQQQQQQQQQEDNRNDQTSDSGTQPDEASPGSCRGSKRRRDSASYFYSRNDRLNDTSPSNRWNNLYNRSLSELRAIAEEHSVDLNGCIERQEIIDRILAADPEHVLSDSLFETWSISEIRALAALVDVDLSSASASSSREAMIEAIRADAVRRPHLTRYLHALAPLAALTAPQLRAVAREWKVPVSDCIEKGEILHRLVTSRMQSP